MYELITNAPDDPILSLIKVFQEDQRNQKVALSVGVYQDENGAIPQFNCIQQLLQQRKIQTQAHSYLPIDGSPDFSKGVQTLLFGHDLLSLLKEGIVTIQTLGASGALKIGGDFLKQLLPNSSIWMSNPSWDNHAAIFSGVGFEVNYYPYYDPITGQINFEAMCKTFADLPRQSIVLLQVCCHNPTGVDLNRDQWKKLIKIIKECSLIPFLDFAYQGFGGELDEDAWPIRQLLQEEVPFLLAQSFSKNMSLYGERVGSLSVYEPGQKHTTAIKSQLKAVVRRNYSSPPRFGAALAAGILQDEGLFTQWRNELATMRTRIVNMRQKLFDSLQARQIKLEPSSEKIKNWDFLLTQKGMFSYTGFSTQQVQKLRKDYAVYLIESGRMCIAGLNTSNVQYVADSLHCISNIKS